MKGRYAVLNQIRVKTDICIYKIYWDVILYRKADTAKYLPVITKYGSKSKLRSPNPNMMTKKNSAANLYR